MERAAELEAEVERLRTELEEATAAKARVAEEQAEAGPEEVKALRVANVTLRRENDRLREQLAEKERRPIEVPRALLMLAAFIVVGLILAFGVLARP